MVLKPKFCIGDESVFNVATAVFISETAFHKGFTEVSHGHRVPLP
jgi:hypothetical protein